MDFRERALRIITSPEASEATGMRKSRTPILDRMAGASRSTGLAAVALAAVLALGACGDSPGQAQGRSQAADQAAQPPRTFTVVCTLPGGQEIFREERATAQDFMFNNSGVYARRQGDTEFARFNQGVACSAIPHRM